MRPIDADTLKAEFTGNFQDSYPVAQIKALIDAAPTLNAKKNKKSKWLLDKIDNYKKFQITCLSCGWSWTFNYRPYVDIGYFNYCPGCGAKMDEE